MRAKVWLVLLCLNSLFKVQAQIEASPDSVALETYFYIDNLGTNIDSCNWIPNLKSDIFIETYYSKLKPSDYKVVNEVNYRPYELDLTKNKKSDIRLYSKKAKSGYLFVNDCVTSRIAEMNHDFNGLKIQSNYKNLYVRTKGETRKIQYIFDGSIVKTKDDVKKILKLKKEQIEVLYVIYDEYSNTYIVSFIRK